MRANFLHSICSALMSYEVLWLTRLQKEEEERWDASRLSYPPPGTQRDSSGMLLLFVFVKPIVLLQQFYNSCARVISAR